MWFGGAEVGRLWWVRVQEGLLEWLAWQRLGWALGVLCEHLTAGAPVGRVGWRRGPVGAGCCPVPLLLPFLWARWEALVELVLMLLRVPSGPVGGAGKAMGAVSAAGWGAGCAGGCRSRSGVSAGVFWWKCSARGVGPGAAIMAGGVGGSM